MPQEHIVTLKIKYTLYGTILIFLFFYLFSIFKLVQILKKGKWEASVLPLKNGKK